MSEFRRGDRVRRINLALRGVGIGAVGTVVSVEPPPYGIRVLYDDARSLQPDGAYKQLSKNIEHCDSMRRDDVADAAVAKPPLGPNIGMFLRDGMSTAAAKLAHASLAGDHLTPKPVERKVRACLPAETRGTLHKAPRQWGALNIAIGIPSSHHVMWGVADLLGWGGK
jgi:hypothetical protein